MKKSAWVMRTALWLSWTLGAASSFVGVLLFSCAKEQRPLPQIKDDAAKFFFRLDENLPEAFHPLSVPQILGNDAELINGNPVQPGAWRFVVRIRTANAACTASVVGPKVIATAAHCANTGAVSEFSINGVTYHAKMRRHPFYPNPDIDVALGILDKEVLLAEYGHLPNQTNLAKVGEAIRLMGYGCTQPGGGGGNDGILREGMTTITTFVGNDIVTRRNGGPALCFGDSGGPAFIQGAGKLINISQNSKGDIATTSYLARWDADETQSFAKKFASDNSVQICGVTRDCVSVDPHPKPKTFVAEGKTTAISGLVKDADTAQNMDEVRTVFSNAIRYLDQKGALLPQ